MSAGGLVWPSYAAVEADGYGVTDDNDVDRTPFDDGLIRQERRYASALTALSITALLANDGDYRRFRAWAGGCAHRWFAWTAPESGSVHQVRVRGGAGGIEYTARVGGDGRRTVGSGPHSRRCWVVKGGPGRRPGRRDRAAREARSQASGASARRLREH